jgi:hypothetical protein
MTQHTPGPWKSEEVMGGARAIHGADCTRIAEMYGPGDRDDIVADARLIAAAPRLLAALEAINRMETSRYCPICGTVARTCAKKRCPWREALAAIREARGE